ncbi:hypothetical protein Poli38472_009931 [Pythium oligandrum]|uniref:RRM domain-containing protein n=1 Tax=Pythium oligandrum TaxID=41045 RepID=A0A8K1C879_PYTOL|nr:hypothetical protein Poli38472_009931 [Pythium oligandrum]|eukprot:TMW58372.1 hypothetical protein Poli38472_009931 [Pythium oligandrum]
MWLCKWKADSHGVVGSRRRRQATTATRKYLTMDTESKELMREWLVRSLEPVCDADPEVLSKYVLALVQNNPHKEGLQETCITKLEEFLGDETTPFVARLFRALETGEYRNEEGQEQEAQASTGQDDRDDSSRRRSRTGSDDDDEHRRFNKRRRDDEYSRDYSPREGGRREGYGGRDGGRGARGPREWDREGRERGYPMDRRRNYPPEWGMPPQGMGMWPPHPHFPPPRGGFPPHPMGDFDPNTYNPENPGMMPPPHMMMPRGPFYPYGGRGGRGRGGYHGGRGAGGPKTDGEGASPGEANGAATPAPVGARTTLRVTNVDPKYVNMTKLSLHFSKFGNVVNVQMRPNYRCAYVQYTTEEEAKKAFHSPIPVCNNRFIEVKWAKYDAKDPQGAPSEETEEGKSAAGEDGKTTDGESKTEEDQSAVDTTPEKEMTPDELRAAALEKGRKVLEEKRELLEKQRQLMKQKEELLKRQLAQQKELLERMSQNPASVSAAEKRELLTKITSLSEELKALQPRRDDQNKLTGLKAELSALEAEAASTGAPYGGRGPARGGGRWTPTGGRGFYRGGRGGRGGGRSPYGHYSNALDNRTTIVKVENLPEEARDPSVLEQHFGSFGAVERVVVDASAPDQGYIKFQDRYSGQTAMTRGGVYGETQLQLSWVEAQDAPAGLANSDSGAAPASESIQASDANTANGESTEVSASA